MDAREELVAAIEAHQWGESFNSAHREHQYSSWCAICKGDVRAVVDALLADGRWLLVHPDEVIRREQLEQVGGIYKPRWRKGWAWTSEDTPDLLVDIQPQDPQFTPVFRVRPAVEKENDPQ